MSRRLAGLVLFSGLVAVVVGCGGTAFMDGGSARAGAAGTSSSGGAGPGGGAAGNGAGAPAAAGASSFAGASGDACTAPVAPGPCDAYLPSFWHDPKSGLCEPFIYGGCQGNANRYPTRAACLEACPGGGSNWGACQVDSDCTLTSVGCCEACEPVADKDLLALNDSHLTEYTGRPACAALGACLPCPPAAEIQATGKYYRAVCQAGQCSVLDVRESAYTECKVTAECALRNGVNCCEECDASGFVPVRSDANFCPEGPEPCPKCALQPPPGNLQTLCDGTHCIFQDTLR